MSTTSTLRIWSHLRQIGPLSGDVTGAAWFSLNLAPIFVADGTATTAVDLPLATRYLQPWTWQWTQSKLRMVLLRKSIVIGVIDVPASQIFREASNPAVLNVFTEEFNCNAKTFNASSFIEAASGIQHKTVVSDDDSSRDWRTYLLHASTYPGDIPLRAGLAVFFNVPYAQLSNADEVIAAPVFANAPFSAPLAPVAPPLTTATPASACSDLTKADKACPLFRLNPDLTPYTTAGQPYVTQWAYAAPSETDLHAQLVQPQTPLRIPGVAGGLAWGNDGFIDEQTLWIRPAESTWQQGVNWHEQLEQRLAGLFDLPQRLLEWADQALSANPPGTIDAAFGQALLATIRDLLRTCGDPTTHQDLRRPDGSTLAEGIANVIVNDPHNETTPGSPNTTIRNPMLTALQKYYADFDTYSAWQQQLTSVLTGPKRFSATELTGAWENPVTDEGKNTYSTWLKRMHRVRAWLFDPDNLRAMIESDWKAALTDPELQKAFQNALTNVDAYLQSLDLVSVLQQGFMGIAWRGQKASDWYTQSAIAQSMTNALIDAYRDRLGLPDPPPKPGENPRKPSAYTTLQPRQDGVSKAQQRDIETYLTTFIAKWEASQTGPKPAANSTPDYSRGNQGLNIQLTNPNVQGADDQTFLGNFRGAAIFMRLSGLDPTTHNPHPWGLLNLGQYSLRGDGTVPGNQVAPPLNTEQIVVAPSQIIYRNGLRQVTFTYRNQPLSARSPAAALSQTRSMQPGDNSNHRQGVFQLWNPYRGASPFRLPRLVFGASYDVAATAIGLAGEMAKEVCDPVRPWGVASDPTTWNIPATSIHTTEPVLRTMPVGLVRVEGKQSRSANNPISKLGGPPIPDTVFPVVRSVIPAEKQQNTLILLADTGDSAAGKAPIGTPATWIPEAVNSMDFYLRPPATDLATFDSWPFTIQPSIADRAQIYSLIAKNTDIFNDGDSSAAPDLTLDDPSVTGFTITLSKLIFPKGTTQVVDSKPVSICRPPAATSTLLQQYQSPHLPVTVEVDATAGVAVPKDCNDTQKVTISVSPGDIYELDITPIVAAADATRFDTDVLKLAPRTFFVEVASPLNVTSLDDVAKALNDSLVLQLNPPSVTNDPDQLQISLDLNKLATETSVKNLAPQIHRVELMVQRWRWQGRPLMGQDAQSNPVPFDFPYTAIKAAGGAADTVLTPLDGVYFGERDTNDQLTVVAQVDAVRDAVVAATSATAPPPPTLYTYDLSHSPQGLYYRFAVRVFSRYEGLLSSGYSVESRVVRAAPASGGTTPEQWRRLLPLCRRTQTAPKPAVRLIIPLTRTGKGEQTPGLLVVINEAWYDWAGLAEKLEVQITSVQDPTTKADYLQAGPDPIVHNPVYTSASNPLNFEPNPVPYGPIGFTFDSNTDAQLFSTTSFIVLAPRVMDPTGQPIPVELSWYFLQLQFRRSVDPDGTLNYTPDLDSDWTDPLQTQLLPASNLWNITKGAATSRVDTATLQGNASQTAGITLTDSNGDVVTVDPLPYDTNNTANRFEVWAVLTRSLSDVFGGAGQEAFVTMVPFAKLATQQSSPATSLRLVEVQAMNTLSPIRTDWQSLANDMFPMQGSGVGGVDPAMARARIVRVSPPIAIVSA